MRKRIERATLLVLAAGLLAGCGTITQAAVGGRRADSGEPVSGPAVYGGVKSVLETHRRQKADGSLHIDGYIYAAIEIPASALLDTVFLPWSLINQGKKGEIEVYSSEKAFRDLLIDPEREAEDATPHPDWQPASRPPPE